MRAIAENQDLTLEGAQKPMQTVQSAQIAEIIRQPATSLNRLLHPLLQDRQKSCSSIRKNRVPQPSTGTNDLVLEVLLKVVEAVHQNIVALHTTNRTLDKDADVT